MKKTLFSVLVWSSICVATSASAVEVGDFVYAALSRSRIFGTVEKIEAATQAVVVAEHNYPTNVVNFDGKWTLPVTSVLVESESATGKDRTGKIFTIRAGTLVKYRMYSRGGGSIQVGNVRHVFTYLDNEGVSHTFLAIRDEVEPGELYSEHLYRRDLSDVTVLESLSTAQEITETISNID